MATIIFGHFLDDEEVRGEIRNTLDILCEGTAYSMGTMEGERDYILAFIEDEERANKVLDFWVGHCVRDHGFTRKEAEAGIRFLIECSLPAHLQVWDGANRVSTKLNMMYAEGTTLTMRKEKK